MKAGAQHKLHATVRGLIVLALLACCGFRPAWAADPAPAPAAAAGTDAATQHESREKATIRAVLADPVFGGEKTEYDWRYTSAAPDKAPDAAEPPSWLDSLRDAIEYLSRILRLLVYFALAIVLAVLIYLTYRYRDAWFGPLKGRTAPPSFLFGLDVRPESLPDDTAATALAELNRGSASGALSLLYRAALVSLIHHSQLDFHAGHTEDDCLSLVRAAVDAGVSGYFAELMDAWKRTAYAHEPPPVPVLESLCTRWPAHFSLAGDTR
jgi:hypothetical protein